MYNIKLSCEEQSISSHTGNKLGEGLRKGAKAPYIALRIKVDGFFLLWQSIKLLDLQTLEYH